MKFRSLSQKKSNDRDMGKGGNKENVIDIFRRKLREI